MSFFRRPVEDLDHDDHAWRELTDEEELTNYASDPHSTIFKCAKCGLRICCFCGSKDPAYTPECHREPV